MTTETHQKEWCVKTFSELGTISAGGTPSRTKPEYFGGTIPWVKTLNLNDGLVLKTEERITESGFASIRGKIRSVGTVMLAMYGGAGTVGKAGKLGVPAATNQAVCCIEPNPGVVDSEYLLFALLRMRAQWMRFAIGTRKDPNISKGIIEKTELLLPSLPEQRAIARALRAVQDAKEARQREVACLDELFRAQLEELMTGRLSAVPLINN